MCQDSTLWELQCRADIGNATIIKNNYSEQVKLIRLYLYNYCELVSLTCPKQPHSGNTGTMNVNESTLLCLVFGKGSTSVSMCKYHFTCRQCFEDHVYMHHSDMTIQCPINGCDKFCSNTDMIRSLESIDKLGNESVSDPLKDKLDQILSSKQASLFLSWIGRS